MMTCSRTPLLVSALSLFCLLVIARGGSPPSSPLAGSYVGGTGRIPSSSPRDAFQQRVVLDDSFQFNYLGAVIPPPGVRDAIELAGSILSTYFDWSDLGPLPIVVNLTLETNGSYLITSDPGSYTDDGGTRYPTMLCRIRSGTCTPPSVPDIVMSINLGADLFISSGVGDPGEDQYDMTTLVLRSLLKGLGMESMATTSGYPFAQVTVFDSFVRRSDTNQLLSTVFGSAPDLTDLIQSGVLEFQCTQCTSLPCDTCGTLPRLYSPGTFDDGSSVSTLDASTYEGSNNQLYTNEVPRGIVVHEVGPFMWKMLDEMGYPMKEAPTSFSTCEECVANFYQWCDIDYEFCEDRSLGPFDTRVCPGDAFAVSSAQCGTRTTTTAATASTTTTGGAESDVDVDDRILEGMSNDTLFGIAFAVLGGLIVVCALCIGLYSIVCIASIALGGGGRFVANSTAVDESRYELDWMGEL